MLRACTHHGLTPLSTQAITALIRAECDAIATQLNIGPQSTSSIFHESVVGEDVLPAGAYVRLVGEVLDNVLSEVDRQGNSVEKVRDVSEFCVRALYESRESVLGAMTCPRPESVCHIDPRPTLAEAWYLSMTSLVLILDGVSQSVYENEMTSALARDSFMVAVHILLIQCAEKEDHRKGGRENIIAQKCCMSLDGPQTFAFLEFMESLFSLGPRIMELAYHHFWSQVDASSANTSGLPCDIMGGAVIAAALFRGGSGILPPWAIETTPGLYSSFFMSCGCDCEKFCLILRLAFELRVGKIGTSYSHMCSEDKLAGHHFEGISHTVKDNFIAQAREICSKNDPDSWRRFKVIIKKICGGKKKATNFNLKPSSTIWDCDRI